MCPEKNKSESITKAHGAISISFIITSLTIGFIAILNESVLLSIIYLVIVISAFIVMSIIYCSKCLCRNNCNHIFIGHLSKIFSKQNSKNYTKSDVIFGAVLPMLIVYIIPQFWLINNSLYFLLFWILTIIGILDVLIFVCRNCRNTKCSMCKSHK